VRIEIERHADIGVTEPLLHDVRETSETAKHDPTDNTRTWDPEIETDPETETPRTCAGVYSGACAFSEW
jgi:hypothetical protein